MRNRTEELENALKEAKAAFAAISCMTVDMPVKRFSLEEMANCGRALERKISIYSPTPVKNFQPGVGHTSR